jgi:flavin reductase (DIM6/NTAB) family NADH-FMN oxidoreductase RutF
VSEIAGRLGSRHERSDENEFPLSIDPRSARWMRRHLAAGVVAVTTIHDGAFRAATVAACMIASIDPFQIAISLERETQMEEWLAVAGMFAVSVLPWRQKFFADQFAGFTPLASPTFAGIDHRTAVTGCPILTASIGWVDCSLAGDLVTGDHHLFIGSVLSAGAGTAADDEPLIYYENHYLRVD